MRIVFMGTPDFSAGILSKLLDAGHEIALVVTKQDKPVGRGGKIAASAVKKLAEERGLPVFQPKRIRDPESARVLEDLHADVGVVAAFGQILSAENLRAPRLGCFNVHASLLPAYRGASPIQQAILDGVPETGVTIMQMDEGIDTGDILLQERLAIAPDETAGTLFDRLMALGGDLIVRALAEAEQGKLQPTPQDETKATLTRTIDKEMGRINWTADAAVLARRVRAMNPWPCAYTRLPDGRLLKIWTAEAGGESTGTPGTVVTEGGALGVVCGDGRLLRILELQLEGKKRLVTKEFLKGFRMEADWKLG